MKTFINDCIKLGFGMMRLPKLADGTIDIEQSKDMVDAFMAAGGKYFDTAFAYNGSEEATRKALVERYPRDSFYLATKLNAKKINCEDAASAREEFRISLERLGTDYIDYYLLHCVDNGTIGLYDDYGLWDYLKELKAQGKVRHYGFSFHGTPELLDELLTIHPDVEFVQLQINYVDWEDQNIRSRACYEIAAKHDMPIVVMEPVKGGMIADPPESVKNVFRSADPDASPAFWAIRYAASLENVAIVLSGMSSMEQMNDNLSYMKDFHPLNDEEYRTIDKALDTFMKTDWVQCTKCEYCKPGCPRQIDIPGLLYILNIIKKYNSVDGAKREYIWRPSTAAKASDCIGCGQCEDACPQHLPIISHMKEIVEQVEN